MHSRSFVVLAAMLSSGTVAAHVQLDEPQRRYDEMKAGPCGRGDGPDGRTDRVTHYDPGETIKVQWTETVDHVGSFRIAFDNDGADVEDFEANVLYREADPRNDSGRQWEASVTLPDVECGNCTLQLVQIMTLNAPTDDDLYHQCADLVLGDVPSAPAEIGTSCNSGPAWPTWLAVAGLAWRRHRRRTVTANRCD